jgi:hypothetical protein
MKAEENVISIQSSTERFNECKSIKEIIDTIFYYNSQCTSIDEKGFTTN